MSSVDDKTPALDDARSYASAILNILSDAAEEKARLADTQRAVLNILEDAEAEKDHLEATQKAILNILDDSAEEKTRLADTQSAVLNILEDAEAEKAHLADSQRAVLNILEDAEAEKAHLADTQRAVLNILDDFDAERNKAERANREMAREIEVRKQAEESLRQAKALADAANRELEAFSYSVAHDLRAPLRSIDGFSQALLEDCADQVSEEGRTYLGYVRESAQQMAQLIDDLLALSRVSRKELNRSRVDLAQIARNVLSHLEREQPGRRVEVVIPREMFAFCDAHLLGIVLENLLGNAWKFTGKVESARIEFGSRSESGRVVYFVRDNGAGFDMAYVQKLFGVFQRLHAAKEFEGTGIGLVTVHRIIHRHGGSVWAQGEVGRGATFSFTLEETR